MKTLSRLGLLAVLVAAIGGVGRGTVSALPAGVQGHASNLRAKFTMLDGASQTVVVQGVGCNTSMCSRVAIKSKAGVDVRLAALGLHKGDLSTWLDTVASIGHTANGDSLFLFRDGTERQLTVVEGNRVFYFVDPFLVSQKVDLAKVRTVEFLSGVQAR